jgi:transcriptional regulator with XRE-family HTH domain
MNVDIKVQFGNRLREIRTQKNISQERLAELAGLDRTYVSKIERGQRNISLEVAARLARALDIDIRGFFTKINEDQRTY